ncbi:Mis12-Mtw1 protein family-domain-containing protein [Auriculariales sp. MPI-PUGE-AT-0066]|nr:Mis12-Mtw1 protein family-domain-containing protein [Auriculariales sp. MPI-PUGE-AT-0066]
MLGVMQSNPPPERSFASASSSSISAPGKRKAIESIDFSKAPAKKRKKDKDATRSQLDFTLPASTPAPAPTPAAPPVAPAVDSSASFAVSVPALSFANSSKAARQTSKPNTSKPPENDRIPAIEKNRALRAEVDKRRKASRASRGKRASSSMGSGVISQPHPNVKTSTYHRHLKPDLPEAIRMQHCLVWCGSWAAKQDLSAASNSSSSKHPTSKLDLKDKQLVKDIQQTVLKMLAEGKIDTTVYSKVNKPPPPSSGPRRAHQQNVLNAQRKSDLMAGIGKAKDEDGAWESLAHEFRARDAVSASSNRSEAKGKGRESLSTWAWDVDLSDRLSKAAAVSRQSLQIQRQRREIDAPQTVSPIKRRLQDVPYNSDRLEQSIAVASTLAEKVHSRLDVIFSNFGESLKARTVPLGDSAPSTATKMLGAADAVKHDPILLLRGISRMDAARPDSQVSAPVRRTRQSMAAAAPPGSSTRQYTAVPAPTPRRPATPRRATPRKPRE